MIAWFKWSQMLKMSNAHIGSILSVVLNVITNERLFQFVSHQLQMLTKVRRLLWFRFQIDFSYNYNCTQHHNLIHNRSYCCRCDLGYDPLPLYCVFFQLHVYITLHSCVNNILVKLLNDRNDSLFPELRLLHFFLHGTLEIKSDASNIQDVFNQPCPFVRKTIEQHINVNQF